MTQEGVLIKVNEKEELIAVVRKDPTSRKNIFYTCREMSLAEIEHLLSNGKKNGNETKSDIPAN